MANYVMFYEEEMKKVAVIVETRKHKALHFVLCNVMYVFYVCLESFGSMV